MPSIDRDGLGILSLLIPLGGVLTIMVTEVLACTYNFDCSRKFPTLSYAATVHPGNRVFALGMCATAAVLLASVLLFCWYARLRLPMTTAREQATIYGCGAMGAGAALLLSSFGLVSSGRYRREHALCGVLFVITSWGTTALVQSIRRMLLWHEKRPLSPLTAIREPPPTALMVILRQSLKRMDICHAYALGRIWLLCGQGLLPILGVLFLCVSGVWPNPLHFTFLQFSFVEVLSLTCQFLFMATLSCELSLLHHEARKSEHSALNRSE